MIEVKNLSHWFGDKQVLFDINVVFESGKTNLVIGSSGHGKTVLMKSMVGLIQPTKGEVYYDGRPFHSISPRERKLIRREIGMLFQGTALFDYMTVGENVRFPLDMLTDMSDKEKEERVAYVLERVQLPGIQHMYPSELSGGMRKRVGLARAIVHNPKYLFCDEPNSGLDPRTAAAIDELIYELTKEFNTTTVINTHDLNSIMAIGEKIVFIYKGHKWWEGNSSTILTANVKELQEFLESSIIVRQLKGR